MRDKETTCGNQCREFDCTNNCGKQTWINKHGKKTRYHKAEECLCDKHWGLGEGRHNIEQKEDEEVTLCPESFCPRKALRKQL